jgi:hypothetical protein
MNTFYERIDDGEFFVYNEESKKFYNMWMKKFTDKGHLIREYTEETLDKLVRTGSFKKHTKNPVVIAQHDVITDLILENKKLKEEIAQLKKNKQMNTEIEILTSIVTKELQEIESNMVQDKVGKNDLNCTTDAIEWLKTIKEIDIETKNTKGTGPNPDRIEDLYNHSNYHYNFDCEIVNNASGYITAPVFTYKTKVEAATSIIFNSLQELKDYLKNKQYLLYMVIVSIKAHMVGTADNGMYTIIPNRPLCGTPEIKYTFRGHILK